MAINTSINKLRDTQNSLDSIKNSISSSISNKMSLVASTISMAKEYQNRYQQEIYNCEKDINLAKKVIDHNQSAIYSFERNINRLGSLISELEWKISRMGYPPKPSSTGNTDVDSANRKEWEDACAAVDDAIDNLKSQKEDAVQAKKRYSDLRDEAEENISELRKIISYIKQDIAELNTLIHNLNVRVTELKRAESIFISACNNAVASLRKVDGRIEDAVIRLGSAIKEFKQAGINMNESSTIDISDINKCNLIMRDIKSNLLSANQSTSSIESAVSNAQRNLKDNITTEASKLIDNFKAQCKVIVDALEQINKAVDKAMEYLKQYENS